jgi:16S rRNA (guanine1207-N2)-methyltransferase
VIDLDALRRHPDLDVPGLKAVDAADRLILDEAASALAGAHAPGDVVVIDDAYGALALAALDAGARDVRVHQDPITGERALAANAARLGVPEADRPRSLPFGPELVEGARIVLLRLPRSLDRLDEVVALVAAHSAPDVRVFAGGRIKHMSLAMNEVLGRRFDRVDVTHARQKSRVLVGSGLEQRHPAATGLAEGTGWPREARDAGLGLTVVAHGGVFAGTSVDIGTRFLLGVLDDAVPDAATAVDLACGSGVVATWLARRRPGLVVHASDRSAAAAASARLTAAANGVGDRVQVTRADGLEHLSDASERLVVLNPPFHSDAAVHTGIATGPCSSGWSDPPARSPETRSSPSRRPLPLVELAV